MLMYFSRAYSTGFFKSHSLIVFFKLLQADSTCSSGNQGVEVQNAKTASETLRLFRLDGEETFYIGLFQGSWDEFQIMNSSSTKIDALDVQLALRCVQCKS